MKWRTQKKGMVGPMGKGGRCARDWDQAHIPPEHLGIGRTLCSRMVMKCNIQSPVDRDAVSPSLQQPTALAAWKWKAGVPSRALADTEAPNTD